MQSELKSKWIEALRSGKYNQGESYLRHENQYCCLGVLCEVMGIGWVGPDEEGDYYPDVEGHRDFSMLTAALLSRAELLNVEQETLAQMNDNGVQFPQIADYIEETL